MRLKNPKAKGARAEQKTKKRLVAAGYYCQKAGGSLGMFDLVAIGRLDTRCIQVKAGKQYCSRVEREQIQGIRMPPHHTKEIWRWPDRAKEPIIEWIR
jgi:hypothetical protein